MQLVPITYARPGMRLGRSVIDTQGRLVLSAGVSLSQRYIDLLATQGYTSLYVGDSLDDVELPEVVRSSTRQEVIQCIKDFSVSGLLREPPARATVGITPGTRGAQPVKRNPGLEARINHAAEILVKEVLAAPEVMIGIVDIKSRNDASFAHSVQVALLCIVLGRTLGLTATRLQEIGIGAILHDIGMTALSEELLAKGEDLTTQEWEAVKSHTTAGLQILQSSKVSLLSAHVAYQHHERWNGTGYPRGLADTDITRYARICAVCDVFDAMTSDRPNRPAKHPFEALSYISDNSGILFDPDVVKALCSVVAPYPIATSVLLSTGEMAVVKKLNRRLMDKPVVVVVKDRDRNYYETFREVDLSKSDTTISSYISWHDESEPNGADASAEGATAREVAT